MYAQAFALATTGMTGTALQVLAKTIVKTTGREAGGKTGGGGDGKSDNILASLRWQVSHERRQDVKLTELTRTRVAGTCCRNSLVNVCASSCGT